MIKNVKKENIRPSSIDLRLGKIFKINSKEAIDIEKKFPESKEIKLPYILKPGEYVLASTIERLEKDKKYFRILGARSRAFRIGLGIQANFFGPYYEGEAIFGIKNLSENKIKLSEGISLIQIAFLEINGETVPVKHDFQSGKIL